MKKIILNIIKIAVFFAVCLIALQHYNTAFCAETPKQVLEDGVYIIKSAINEKYVLDIYNNSKQDGANLELWTNNKGENQKFNVKHLGDGVYSIKALHSKKSIDVEGNQKTAGTNVLQWTYNGQSNQKWIIKDAGNGLFKIISKSSKLCLDIPYSKAENGANVQVWNENGGKNQMFKFEKQKTSNTTNTGNTGKTVTIPKGSKTVENGTYSIKSAINEKFVFDIFNNSKQDGANLELWTNNNGDNQKFTLKYLNDGTYSIIAVNSKKSIDVEGNQKTAGTNVLQWTYNEQENQKWIIKDAGNGYYNIISNSCGLYLDIPNLEAKNGANVQVWNGNGGKNQLFKLTKQTEGNSTNTGETTTTVKIPNIDTTKYPGYKEKIQELAKAHPNWNFEFLYTGLKFEDVVKGEASLHSRNLVPSGYNGEWLCLQCGTKLYDSGWYCASEKATAYYMDPRNFLDETNIFQFQNVNEYNEGVCTLQGIQSQVKDTYLQNYSKDIYNACKNKKVNVYYIIARLIQEQGRKGTTIGTGMNGGDGKTYYNPFDIGASGNGYSQIYENALATAKKYGWDSMQKAIEGGIDFCKKNWLDNYQNTLYQNKFDIDTRNGTSLYTHQYMQNLMGAYSEARLLKNMYVNTNSLNEKMTFIIPVYENMNTKLSQLPKKDETSSSANTARVKTSDGNGCRVRSKPSTSSTIITALEDGTTVIILESGKDKNIDGYDWCKVQLLDGRQGYMPEKFLVKN